MQNVYHVLHKIPTVNIYYLGQKKYCLAQELIKQGLIRIDTNYYCNFVYYVNNSQNIKLTFSVEELFDDVLLKKTKKKIQMIFLKKKVELHEREIEKIISKQKEKTKLLNIPPKDLLEDLTYLLVQSAHNIVLQWIIKDRVEIFLTYGRNIGDVMDINSWKYFGNNSGMQASDLMSVSIYVSCGGDPFGDNHSNNKTIGDGWAALARLQIIAAQEIGHFADIRRNSKGHKYGRYSVTTFAAQEPNPYVEKARQADIGSCKFLLTDLTNNFQKFALWEKNFMQNQIVKNSFLTVLIKKMCLKILIFCGKIKLKTRYVFKEKLKFVDKYISEEFPVLSLEIMLKDMLANLAPDASVYQRSTKLEKDAIACVEALARVPQQSIKWGHVTTKYLMKNLYDIYYGQIINDLVKIYGGLFHDKSENFPIQKKIKFFIQKFKKRSQFTKLSITSDLVKKYDS